MRHFAKLCLALCASTLLLTGCQRYIQPTEPSTSQIPQASNQFNLQGKIGVKTPQQSGSAFFSWSQQQDKFAIELSGILGMGKTLIEGEPGQVSLNSAKTGLIYAASAEELLQRATGWQAPISHLIHWVQARPATLHAQLDHDPLLRPLQIIEDGWVVNLSYQDNSMLPNKLILKQVLESGQENRITMLIQNRE